MEIWKVIPSDPSLMASSFGRIQVIPYQRIMPWGGLRWYGGTVTKGQWDGERYIYARKGYKTRKVHRLVCEAFNGPCPEGLVCMHLDENSANNVPTNLQWGTPKDNSNFPKLKAYQQSRTGVNSAVYIGRNK